MFINLIVDRLIDFLICLDSLLFAGLLKLWYLCCF